MIFYHSPEQKKTAENVISELSNENLFDKPIVTETIEFIIFYPAEDYHKDYFENNPNEPYCASVIAPKVAKFRQKFLSQLRK